MLRKKSEAVSEGNYPVHQEEELGFGQHALADQYREIRGLPKQEIRLDEIARLLEQLSACLQHEAWQPRLAMEADGHANPKTRERTEGAATAVRAMRGGGFSAHRVEPGSNTNSTSFGVKAEPPALPYRDDVVVESGDAAPKSCHLSLEMRSSTAAGGLVPTDEASTATETNSNQSALRFHSTEETVSEASSKETNLRTTTQYASYDRSVFQDGNQLPAPSGLRVLATKPKQNMTFDPGACQGRLRACPFLGSWRALVCGVVIRLEAAGDELQHFIGGYSLALRNKAGSDAVQEKVKPSRAARDD